MPLTDPATGSGPDIPADQHDALYQEVGNLLNESGGVAGLAQQFEASGLGGLISSWIGMGSNTPMAGSQLIQVIGQDRIRAIAAKLGLSEEQVTMGISMILPKVIDGLTPHGAVPEHQPTQLESAVDMLRRKFLGF